MRHRNTTKTLGRKKQSREMMLRNLASSVLIYEKVKTTETKAKVVKPIVEKMITIYLLLWRIIIYIHCMPTGNYALGQVISNSTS